jgi:hypothetical protein
MQKALFESHSHAARVARDPSIKLKSSMSIMRWDATIDLTGADKP